MKADKFTKFKCLHSRNIPAVFCKDDVSNFSNPFIFTKFVHPPNKKSIFSTLEEEKEVKSTVSKFVQPVNVYIILVIEVELRLDKLTLIKSVHPSNIKSNVIKDSLKLIFICIVPVISGIIVPSLIFNSCNLRVLFVLISCIV